MQYSIFVVKKKHSDYTSAIEYEIFDKVSSDNIYSYFSKIQTVNYKIKVLPSIYMHPGDHSKSKLSTILKNKADRVLTVI